MLMIVFSIIVLVALIVDLKSHKEDQPISLKNAAIWSIFWVLVSLGFAGYIALTKGNEDASLFLSGYFLEKSLSVDNLFVFMAIFSSFAIADRYQHRILYYGIIGAIVLRLIFISIGTSLLLLGKWVLLVFGLFVLYSAYEMWKQSNDDDSDDVDYNKHWSVLFTERFFPVETNIVDHSFFVTKAGKYFVTPLFLCLVCIEVADVMFAFDSVPAVIAITQDPYLVFTSNIFAILGLRSMYFLLSAANKYLAHLEKAVIGILVFIGVKMIIDFFGIVHISPLVSLAIVFGFLVIGIIASLFHKKDA